MSEHPVDVLKSIVKIWYPYMGIDEESFRRVKESMSEHTTEKIIKRHEACERDLTEAVKIWANGLAAHVDRSVLLRQYLVAVNLVASMLSSFDNSEPIDTWALGERENAVHFLLQEGLVEKRKDVTKGSGFYWTDKGKALLATPFGQEKDLQW